MVSKSRLFLLILEIYYGDLGMGVMEKVVLKPTGQALSLRSETL